MLTQLIDNSTQSSSWFGDSFISTVNTVIFVYGPMSDSDKSHWTVDQEFDDKSLHN